MNAATILKIEGGILAAAAPAAAPIAAPRTRPVAVPPMIAPIAAPTPAVWPINIEDLDISVIKSDASLASIIAHPNKRR